MNFLHKAIDTINTRLQSRYYRCKRRNYNGDEVRVINVKDNMWKEKIDVSGVKALYLINHGTQKGLPFELLENVGSVKELYVSQFDCPNVGCVDDSYSSYLRRSSPSKSIRDDFESLEYICFLDNKITNIDLSMFTSLSNHNLTLHFLRNGISKIVIGDDYYLYQNNSHTDELFSKATEMEVFTLKNREKVMTIVCADHRMFDVSKSTIFRKIISFQKYSPDKE